MVKTEISEKEKNPIIIAYASHYTRVFIDPTISTLIPILIIAMMLVIRPHGLFGRKRLNSNEKYL